MQIRPATLADIEEITRLKMALVVTSWSDDPHYLDAHPDYPAALRERVAELVQHPRHHYWMAVEGDQVLGCLSASIEKHLPGPDWSGIHAHLSDLYVVPERRGQGVAKLLMEAAMAWSRAQGADGVDLHATRMARPMYEALGWQHRQPEPDDARFFSMSWRFDQHGGD